MDFATVVLFLVIYYLRPQEWTSLFATIHFAQIVILMALGTLVFRKHSLQLSDLFRTPHDWAVLAFWLWIVFSSPTPWPSFKDSFNLYIFYIVIAQTLNTIPRLRQFLGWWTFLIVSVAALALLSLVGLDPLGSLDITNGPMKGRLMLNLSIFDNPNALGHSVVPAIPLLYYFCIWKKPAAMRVLGVALMAVVATCIFLTQSKGAFISAAVTILATLTFGRPKSAQIAIICIAAVFGGSLLYSLPRMNELKKAKTDEAIQGRIIAFTHGYKMMTTTTHGVGYHNWGPSFLAGHYRYKRTRFDKKSLMTPMPIIYKAAHSCYVCIGAELGYPGFYLFFGILYCCLRTVVTAKTSTPDEERVRRILFVLICSYMVSSWMVDFAYRPTFFMFAAATAALHRHLSGFHAQREQKEKEEAEQALKPAVIPWRENLPPEPALEIAAAPMSAPAAVLTMDSPAALEPDPESVSSTQPRIAFGWNHIGWVDLVLTLAMTYAAVRYWAYLLLTM
jgi:hypothetical protein